MKGIARGQLQQALFTYLSAQPVGTVFKSAPTIRDILTGLGVDDPQDLKHRRAVRKCFYKLVGQGCAVLGGHGAWVLTEEGARIAEARKQGIKPARSKGIDASPPKNKPESKPSNPLTVDPGTVFDGDAGLKQKLHYLNEVGEATTGMISRVDSVKQNNDELAAQLREVRRQVEHLKLDRAISQAQETKRQVEQRLQAELDRQAQLRAELKSLQATLRGLQADTPTDTPSSSEEDGCGDQAPSGGDDEEEAGEGDDDPDPMGPAEGERQGPIKPKAEKLGDPDKNYTSEWLAKHLRPAPGQTESVLMKKMRAAVRAKCPISASAGKVDDHVQEYLLKLVRRDGLRKKILAGSKITYSHLASYAVRSAWSDARNAGTEPVERELYGARTERERRNWAKEGKPETRRTKADKRIVWGRGADGEVGVVGVVDKACGVDLSFQQRKDFEAMWSRVEAVMRAKKPLAWKRYAGILKMRYLGFSADEIAKAENVSTFRAASLIQEAKKAIRAVGADALRA